MDDVIPQWKQDLVRRLSSQAKPEPSVFHDIMEDCCTENVLEEMEIGLCAHGEPTVTTELIRDWFENPEILALKEMLRKMHPSRAEPTPEPPRGGVTTNTGTYCGHQMPTPNSAAESALRKALEGLLKHGVSAPEQELEAHKHEPDSAILLGHTLGQWRRLAGARHEARVVVGTAAGE